MRHLYSVLVIMFVGMSITFAQTKTSTLAEAKNVEKVEKTTEEKKVDGPDMTFESRVIDYGTIEQNADPYRYFKFTNTGKSALIITSAKGSCGCTVPTFPQEAIEPGESGEIKVRYATNRIGQFRKTVTLTTNMAEEETIVLTIEGKVNKKAEAPSGVPAVEENMFRNNGNSKNKN